MGERGMRIKSDINKEGWEDSEFPIVCETCLGDNPYVRMARERHGKACKICERPFTAFRWKPGQRARYKTTQLCQTCAKSKNVCQVCILDLEYGLPVQVRDSVLAQTEQQSVPQSDVNRQWFIQQEEQQEAQGAESGYKYGKAAHENLLRVARKSPYYRRNLPHLCSFYARGECSRGDSCPYLHEMPRDRNDPLAKQNMKDRYYGVNDPVANKIQNRMNDMPALPPPEDKGICTLWIGGLTEEIGREDMKDAFYSYGEIRKIHMVPRQRCAFVEFTTRDAAERAAEQRFNNLYIKGIRLKLTWASRPQAADGRVLDRASDVGQAMPPPPGPPPMLPPPGPPLPRGMAPSGLGAASPYYPSMDPRRLGATMNSHRS